MLNISQFLHKAADLKNRMAWMLAYVCTLQWIREATEGQKCHLCGMHFSMEVSLLVDAFDIEMGVEVAEVNIMLCWCLGASKIPPQKKDGPFADAITFLNELVKHRPSICKWDKQVHLPLLSPDSMPHWGHHLNHVLGLLSTLEIVSWCFGSTLQNQMENLWAS